MKNLRIIKFLFLFAVLLMALINQLAAQNPTTITTAPAVSPFTSAESAFNWYTAVYTALITALTYIQGWLFPNAGGTPKTVLRWVLIAGVTGGIFIALGLTNGLGVFLGFIGSAIAYDKILQPLGISTPKGAGTK